jgi:uncharacterized protein (TIGR02246 family)
MKTIYAVIISALLLLFSACAQRVNDPADVQAIKDANTAWDKAWSAGDAEALASLYTTDAIAMAPNQPAEVGRDAMRASSRKYFGQFSDENRSVVDDVRVSGDLAVARGTQETKTRVKAGGASFQDKSKWISAYQRQPDGSWKILWEMYNSDLPVVDSLPLGEDEIALMKIEQEWAAASVRNDWPVFDRMFAPDYVNNVDGLIMSKKQFLANMKSGAWKIASALPSELKVLVLGETAIVHGLWTEKSSLNDQDLSGTYRYTDIFAKRDGRWLCVTSYSTKVR